MFTNILLTVDGSDASLQAARRGIELARSLGAQVTVLTVTVPWASYFSRELAVIVPDIIVPKTDYDLKRDTMASGVLNQVATEARDAGVAAKPLHRCHSDPSQAILATAAAEGCDLIVMASHCPRGITGALIGSDTVRVLTHSSVPILVYRDNG